MNLTKLMEVKQCIDGIKNIQNNLLLFLDDKNNEEENFLNLIELFEKHQIVQDHNKLYSFLYLLAKISNNHYRSTNFFQKIEKILTILKDPIKKFYKNTQIFSIFKKNRRIILFLIETQIISIDESILLEISDRDNFIINTNLIQYLFPKSLNTPPENFYEERRIGENDTYLCELIRKDLIDEFITFVNKNEISLSSEIEKSLFETNLLLLKNEIN